MIRAICVLFALTAVLSAQVRLRYLDLGLQPKPCCMTNDTEGNAYIVGSYLASAAPLAGNKIIVYKINPANGTVYRLIFGGSGYDIPAGVAVDANGNLIVAGGDYFAGLSGGQPSDWQWTSGS